MKLFATSFHPNVDSFLKEKHDCKVLDNFVVFSLFLEQLSDNFYPFFAGFCPSFICSIYHKIKIFQGIMFWLIYTTSQSWPSSWSKALSHYLRASQISAGSTQKTTNLCFETSSVMWPNFYRDPQIIVWLVSNCCLSWLVKWIK